MSRELVVLGTASQAPTRTRNHHGALLRWDDEGVLLDPGENTQRQLLLAGVPSSAITRICITHLHGDHCLGLPGVLARMALDGRDEPVDLYFPASGLEYVQRLLTCVVGRPAPVRLHPVVAKSALRPVDEWPGGLVLSTAALDHRIDACGWRLTEPSGRRMLPEELAARGISGPDVGRLQRDGVLDVGGQRVHLDDVSAPRPGQAFAFVMDTRPCAGAAALAEGADLLVAEATFLDPERLLADRYRHMTAGQAGELAASAGAGRLVLTHFSQRYPDVAAAGVEAGRQHGDVVAVRDLDRVRVPPRRPGL